MEVDLNKQVNPISPNSSIRRLIPLNALRYDACFLLGNNAKAIGTEIKEKGNWITFSCTNLVTNSIILTPSSRTYFSTDYKSLVPALWGTFKSSVYMDG